MKTLSAVKNHISQVSFTVRVDVPALKAYLFEIASEIDSLYIELIQKAYSLGLPKFQPTSNKQKLLLFKALGMDVKSARKSEYLKYIDDPTAGPILKKLESLLHKKKVYSSVMGNQKGENCLFDDLIEENGSFFYYPETIMTDGRMYQGRLYSLPMEIRSFILPPEGESFVYLDLSVAELTLLAHLSGDSQLYKDIFSGEFWSFWYAELGISSDAKPALKVSIYSCVYSLSDNSIIQPIPKSFVKSFFTRYPKLHEYLRETVRRTRRAGGVGIGWNGDTFTVDLSEKKWIFKALNYPIQRGLANIVLSFAEHLLEVSQVSISSINFDSMLIYNSDESQVAVLMEEAMTEYQIKFLYKMSSGRNYREAQEG